VPTSIDFLSRFDAGGRFRDGDGVLEVTILTSQGGRYPGRMTFRSGLCIAAEMKGYSLWSYPDRSPLNGLRLLLYFDREEPLVVLVDQGRVLTPDASRPEASAPDDAPRDLSRREIRIAPRAHTALLSLPESERNAVIAAVTRLADSPPSEWPEIAQQLGADQPGYLLWLSSELRAFIRLNETGEVELLDLINEATLRAFLGRPKVGSSAG